MQKQVTLKNVKNQFSLIGITIIAYAVLLIYIPFILRIIVSNYEFKNTLNIDIYTMFMFIIIAIGSFIPFVLLNYISRIKLSSLFKITKFTLKDLFKDTLLLFLIESFFIFLLVSIARNFDIQINLLSNVGMSLDETLIMDWFYILIFVVLSPIIEEFVYRGPLFSCIEKYSYFAATIITSFIFAIMHTQIIEIVSYFFIGIALSIMRKKYNSLIPLMIIHLSFNVLLYLIIIIPYNTIFNAVFLILIIASIAFNHRFKKTFVLLTPDFNDLQVVKLFYKNAFCIISIIVIFSQLLLDYIPY